MDSVDRYLRTARRYLPAADRDDIVAELSANISAEIEDRERELGRPLDDVERDALLARHGHPIKVALGFSAERKSFSFGSQLVGPLLFPSYIRVLGLNLLLAVIISLVAAYYGIPSWTGTSNILAHVFIQFAIVTIVFVAMQRYLDKPAAGLRPRAVSDSVTADAPRRGVSRFASVANLVWLVGSNVWLFDVLRAIDPFHSERSSTLVLAPIWHATVLPYIALLTLELTRNAVNFVRPDLLRFRAAMIAVASATSLIVLAVLWRAGALVIPSDPNDVGQVAMAHAIDAGSFWGLLGAAGCAIAVTAWQLRRFFMLRDRSVPVALMLGVLALATLSGRQSSAPAVSPLVNFTPSITFQGSGGAAFRTASHNAVVEQLGTIF